MERRDEGALRAATTEQLGRHSRAGRSQTAFSAKTLRAAGLLSVAGVESFPTARCGRCAPPRPPWPQPKSLAAAPLVVSKPALKRAGPRYDLQATQIATFLEGSVPRPARAGGRCRPGVDGRLRGHYLLGMR